MVATFYFNLIALTDTILIIDSFKLKILPVKIVEHFLYYPVVQGLVLEVGLLKHKSIQRRNHS